MSLEEAAKAIREKAERSARRASPPPERFRIVRLEPRIELESLSSDVRLFAGDDDVDFPRGFRETAEVGDLIAVVNDRHGDRFVVAVAKPGKIDKVTSLEDRISDLEARVSALEGP